ncbi:sugar transporter [Burkholderia sp. IDO3]|nr:sugar transporter [Burkholderia sp. IDO3]PCD60662.1 sugar transporter [Burkholderia sp. IDO3]
MSKALASNNLGPKRVRYAMGATLLSCLVTLGGCGAISGAGPLMTSITSDKKMNNGDYPYQLIDLSPSNIVAYMKPAETAPLRKVAAPIVPEVRLLPGDVLKVMISDDNGTENTVFAPLAKGGTIFGQVRVDAKGRISLPYMGAKKVSGLTLADVEDVIRRGVMGRASEPQVHVELVGDLSGSVLVAGAVKNPGRFTSLQGPLTLLDAINQAGGPLLDPYLINVTLRTGKTVDVFNYQDLLSGNNISVPPNSEIVLERSRKRFVAMGAVTQPGLHDFPSASPTLLEVLGSVGGLSEHMANPSGVFVFRLAQGDDGGKSKAEVFRLDMREPVSMFLAKSFLVQSDDTVYVTNSPVYEMQKIIGPIVQVLVLGRSVSNY